MFTNRFFNGHYFALRYFPKVGEDGPPPIDDEGDQVYLPIERRRRRE